MKKSLIAAVPGQDDPDSHEPTSSSKSETRLIPLVDWPKFHPWPPIGGLRHLAFFARQRGFAKAFVKVGRRLLIDEAEFFRVVKEMNQATNNEGFSK